MAICSKCGSEMRDGVCPWCERKKLSVPPPEKAPAQSAAKVETNGAAAAQPAMVTAQSVAAGNLGAGIFADPNEKFVCALGGRYVTPYRPAAGFAIVSDRRIYIRGKTFLMGEKGYESSRFDTGNSQYSELKDVTCTLTRMANHAQLVKSGIGCFAVGGILSLLGLIFMIIGFAKGRSSASSMSMSKSDFDDLNIMGVLMALGLGFGLLFLIAGIITLLVGRRKNFYVIEISGRQTAFLASKYSPEEWTSFQQLLLQAKEKSANAAMQSAVASAAAQFGGFPAPQFVQPQPIPQPVPQPQIVPPQNQPYVQPVSNADEISKYLELYKNGVITKEEFDEIKAKLLANIK